MFQWGSCPIVVAVAVDRTGYMLSKYVAAVFVSPFPSSTIFYLDDTAADSCKRFLEIIVHKNLSQFQLDKAGVHFAVDLNKKYDVGSGDMRRCEIERKDNLIAPLGVVLEVHIHKMLRGDVSMRYGKLWLLLVVSNHCHIPEKLLGKRILGQ